MANDKKPTVGRPDTPLAPTPPVKKSSSPSQDRETAYGKDMSKYGYVRDETVSKYKK
jgi:hypothetical protein